MGNMVSCTHLTHEPFTFRELYNCLNNKTMLMIMLYLREKNPKVPLKVLAKLIGKNEKEARELLSVLISKEFVDVEGGDEYSLNLRARNALNLVLAE